MELTQNSIWTHSDPLTVQLCRQTFTAVHGAKNSIVFIFKNHILCHFLFYWLLHVKSTRWLKVLKVTDWLIGWLKVHVLICSSVSAARRRRAPEHWCRVSGHLLNARLIFAVLLALIKFPPTAEKSHLCLLVFNFVTDLQSASSLIWIFLSLFLLNYWRSGNEQHAVTLPESQSPQPLNMQG